MKNNLMTIKKTATKVLSLLIAPLLFAVLPNIANAHALKENSARVTLRDGQIEVRVWVDMGRWQTQLQDNQAWLLGDIQQIMPAGLTTKETKVFFEKVINEETSLTLNNQRLPLKLLTISHAKASQLTSTAEHHTYSEILLSTKHTMPVAKQLNIRFPKSLGAVHASFVKPKYQMVAAGNTAQVSFLATEKNTQLAAHHHQNPTNLTKLEPSKKDKHASAHTH